MSNTEHMRELLEKIERLEAENMDMRKALEYYIDSTKNIYYTTGGGVIVIDNGARAREVLAKWGEK